MSTIQLTDIVKRYGDGYLAVDRVGLDVRDGEFMILVGPSGCGKSTLLRMIVGLEDLTSGSIHIDGRRVDSLAPRDRNLAMVFQNYALYPHLTVFENIAFPLRLTKGKHTEDEITAKVQHAARLLDLHDHLNRRPAQLSGGQRQRVAMGRAIVRDAQAFLFDEPLSNLDAKLRGQMRTEIARMQRAMGMTTIYVTHDQTEAMTLGDRVAVLRRGVLQQCASPRELYEQPLNLFVAGFIGSPPMNFLPATIHGETMKLPFGDIPLTPAQQAALEGRNTAIVGIRPEHLEDAALAGRGTTDRIPLRVPVDVTEWLGSELYAYVPYAADPDIKAQLAELDRDLDGETIRTQMVVNLDPRSRIRAGTHAELLLDPTTLHLFDPATGRCLTRDDAAATRIAQESEADRLHALRSAQHAQPTPTTPTGEHPRPSARSGRPSAHRRRTNTPTADRNPGAGQG
ncbi:Trehalose import ATP-binding protein SugC [Austwickia sp. TVS 96-490-7B]|uniref:ABC transporter ATP-binding protein n=1 Tax=Austwickia sp. TVS 96-490-7B TaxID=2830843 RepID=UPI001C59BA5A|nr:sn-glycerol-3-phosphate ABC transporter ATP-binding protein UgpC [Austwickia sp. TVS 96-490-7B]MBW3085872.1 Trehalose import ATP-binding protein SugC [Austwickia sp. TVS 96-490-7B]